MIKLGIELQNCFKPDKQWQMGTGVSVSNDGKYLYLSKQSVDWIMYSSKDKTLELSVRIMDNKKIFAEYRIYPDHKTIIKKPNVFVEKIFDSEYAQEYYDPRHNSLKKAALSFVAFLGQSMKVYNNNIELFCDIGVFLDKRIMPQSNIN